MITEHTMISKDLLLLLLAFVTMLGFGRAGLEDPDHRHDHPMDCFDILQNDSKSVTGVYSIWPRSRVVQGPVNVLCNMDYEGGGWTVIQRRGDFSKPKDYFFREWKDYKIGFGNLRQDFWLGNDLIFALTNQRESQLEVVMTDWEGNVTQATYRNFWVEDELRNYTLRVGNFHGSAGDSLSPHNGAEFSTKERSECASVFKGAWWYKMCHTSNLNGLYLRGEHESFADGVNWLTFRGYHYSLKDTYMGIRPRSYNP